MPWDGMRRDAVTKGKERKGKEKKKNAPQGVTACFQLDRP